MQKLSSMLVRLIEDCGYFATISRDMDLFAEVRRNTPNNKFVLPTFDPAHHSQNGSAWIDISKDGKTVGMVAWKMFQTSDFLKLVSIGKVWYENPNFKALNLVTSRNIAGKIMYRGGQYIDPEHRKISGLSWAITRLSREIAIREKCGWIAAHSFQNIAKRDFPTKFYGHTATYLCLDGKAPFPPTGICEPVFMQTVSRSEMVNQSRLEREFLIANSDKNLPAIVKAVREADKLTTAAVA